MRYIHTLTRTHTQTRAHIHTSTHTHLALDGRAEDGTYLTAPAKTYPPKMCEVIAVALHERAGRCLRQHAGVLPFECEPEERLQRLAIPVNWYEPASWAAFTHDCAA